jgi:type IV secretory pathway ATPase VirB11/archaellum biosynthesis ATPase
MPQLDSRDSVIGRGAECRRLIAAIRIRESRLICGPADAGKTTLVKMAIRKLPGVDSKRCIYWSGAATVRQLEGVS